MGEGGRGSRLEAARTRAHDSAEPGGRQRGGGAGVSDPGPKLRASVPRGQGLAEARVEPGEARPLEVGDPLPDGSGTLPSGPVERGAGGIPKDGGWGAGLPPGGSRPPRRFRGPGPARPSEHLGSPAPEAALGGRRSACLRPPQPAGGRGPGASEAAPACSPHFHRPGPRSEARGRDTPAAPREPTRDAQPLRGGRRRGREIKNKRGAEPGLPGSSVSPHPALGPTPQVSGDPRQGRVLR